MDGKGRPRVERGEVLLELLARLVTFEERVKFFERQVPEFGIGEPEVVASDSPEVEP